VRPRDNPFRIERLHELPYRFAEGDRKDFLDRIRQLQFRGAIIGPHGSGKTTLIEQLVQWLHQENYATRPLRLNEFNRIQHQPLTADWLKNSPQDTILILDGAEQLHRSVWKKLATASLQHAGLIITSHQPGFLPTLIECRTSVKLLADLTQALLGGDKELSEKPLADLYQRHRGNIRDCLRELYDAAAEGKLEFESSG